MTKFLITLSCGIDNPEQAHISFVFANTALDGNNEVQIWLFASSIDLCRIGQTEGLVYPPFRPLRHLIDEFISKGGKIYLFEPSSTARLFNKKKFIHAPEVADVSVLIQESIGAIVFNF